MSEPASSDPQDTTTSPDAPGAVSAGTIAVPVKVPPSTKGNTVNVIALLNPQFGDVGVNE